MQDLSTSKLVNKTPVGRVNQTFGSEILRQELGAFILLHTRTKTGFVELAEWDRRNALPSRFSFSLSRWAQSPHPLGLTMFEGKSLSTYAKDLVQVEKLFPVVILEEETNEEPNVGSHPEELKHNRKCARLNSLFSPSHQLISKKRERMFAVRRLVHSTSCLKFI